MCFGKQSGCRLREGQRDLKLRQETETIAVAKVRSNIVLNTERPSFLPNFLTLPT
jgi:hypothetical protein